MTRYRQELRAFNRLRQDCSPVAKAEYEIAIKTLLERYNTTIYENRFLAGGAVEVFTYALLRSVGIDCTLYGSQAISGDILLPNDRRISVKGVFIGGPANVKLMNKQGGGQRKWQTATLFVVSEVGIVFGAPDMVEQHVRDTSDGLELKKAGLEELIADPENSIQMDLARKPPTEMTGLSHRASTAAARQILYEVRAQSLLKAFPDMP